MANHPTAVSRKDVLIKCDFFVDSQLWPLKSQLNPEGWLGNFKEEELPYAVMLLNAFLYFSEQMVNEMYVSAVSNISANLRVSADSQFSLETKWRIFKERALFTFVTGEDPSLADSGRVFARKARQLLGISEDRIVEPEVALKFVLGEPRPVVFVDDFVGSGNQCRETWARQISDGPYKGKSFAAYNAITSPTDVYYCPLICTEAGLQSIKTSCAGLTVLPSHVVGNRYSALAADSIVWPQTLLAASSSFLRNASLRAGIPENPSSTQDWRGFHQLGLTLAFYHSVPDATLPIFYWEENGWTPLIKKQ